MKTGLLMLITGSIAALAMQNQGEVRPAAFGAHDRTMPVTAANGERVLTVRETRTDVTLPSGKRQTGALLVLFDSQTGFYISRLGSQAVEAGPMALADHIIANSAAYVAADRLVLFSAISPALYICESSRKASSVADPERNGLAEAKDQLDDIEHGRSRAHFVSLVKIGQDFVAPPGDSFVRPVKILGVAAKDAAWELTLKGQWTAKVTIEGTDPNYVIRSFARVVPAK